MPADQCCVGKQAIQDSKYLKGASILRRNVVVTVAMVEGETETDDEQRDDSGVMTIIERYFRYRTRPWPGPSKRLRVSWCLEPWTWIYGRHCDAG